MWRGKECPPGPSPPYVVHLKETLRRYKDMGLLFPAHQGINRYFILTCGNGTEARKKRSKSWSAWFCVLQSPAQSEVEANSGHGSPDLHGLSGSAALLVREWERQSAPASNEDEKLIAVLEQCWVLCGRYRIQMDLQLVDIRPLEDRGELEAVSHLYTRIKEKRTFPVVGRSPLGAVCIALRTMPLLSCTLEQGLNTAGEFRPCNLAGFILDAVAKNAISRIPVGLLKES